MAITPPMHAAAVSLAASAAVDSTATNISVGAGVKRSGTKRLGINIGGQAYLGSSQMLRNLVFRNPGFEGETWQSVLQCQSVTATSCTDGNIYNSWPANFLTGGQYEFVDGAATGSSGTIVSSKAADFAVAGVTITFAQPANPPAIGDFVIVKATVPGNATAGWWPNTSGGGTLTTEFSDLSPNTPGKQALRMTASSTGQSAGVSSYFDSNSGQTFVQLHGTYQLAFRAKGTGGSNQLYVELVRNLSAGNEGFVKQTVTLTPAWKDYTINFSANETGQIGTVALGFEVNGASALLDDVSLAPASATASNPTAFRDEVVSTLTALNPGVLRYMDGGPGFGSSVDNIIAVPFARVRAGWSTQSLEQDDIAIGLHEFLQLCQTVGAEPWYTMPATMSTAEMHNLMDYLGGSPTTVYGAKRAARGQSAPWTSVFPVIHLELGSTQWSTAESYGARVSAIFGAARTSGAYSAANFDLIMESSAPGQTYTTSQGIASSSGYDTVAVAPYIFRQLNDVSSSENIFGPMFAEPEAVDSVSTGYMAQQAATVAGKANLAVSEVQLGTQEGSATQSAVNAVVPSIGAALTVAEHMLLMMRDNGVKTQNVWALPGFSSGFNNPGGGYETSPLFGAVVDMGGASNLRRPLFLAEQLANAAILPTMLSTSSLGANPTWNQASNANNSIQLNGAHLLQSFAFSDGVKARSIVVFNLDRASAVPVTFSGVNAPTGTVAVSQLTSANLTDTNEAANTVAVSSTTLSGFQPGLQYSLPPFSMTVFNWQAPALVKAVPVVAWATPAAITQGTPLSATQLNATASVPGTFVYTPGPGATPSAGTTMLSAVFIPTDSADYSSAAAAVNLTVNKLTPIIAWTTPAAVPYGTKLSAAQLNATASVAGAFVYTPAAGTMPKGGTDALSVTFTPTDTTDYNTATKTVSVTVSKATPAVAWAAPAGIVYGTGLSGVQLNATASVPGNFAYSPSAGNLPPTGTDTLSVTFTPTDTADYNTVIRTVGLTVARGAAVLTWNAPAPIIYGTTLAAPQLSATASVPGTFVYTPAAGTRLTAGLQTLSVSFTPADTINYGSATKSVPLVVNKATPVITWPAPLPLVLGTALSALQLNATASVPGSFVYSPGIGFILPAGAGALSATFTPTDTADYTVAIQTATVPVVGTLSTNIAIGTSIQQSGVKRLGMNIEGQNFYDSGQMLRNLVFKNPGFEGETWQSILSCTTVTATSCTDGNPYTVWPSNFFQGATYEFLSGSAKGATGTVASSTAASYQATPTYGVTVNFSNAPAPAVGDYYIVRKAIPDVGLWSWPAGGNTRGWWPFVSAGATIASESTDISPNSPGKEAVLMSAAGTGQQASVTSFFDSYEHGHSFVQITGPYQVKFRAKGTGGNNRISVSLGRNLNGGVETLLNQTLTLTSGWQDYTLNFTGAEDGTKIGTAALSFVVSGANVLLDDVSLTPASSPLGNPTAFRDEVVSTLTALHPGVLRYMDAGTDFGSSIDNMIAPPFGRVRAGFSTEASEQQDVPLGLPEFLQLCQTVGAEPWYTMPAAMSATEMQHLIEYLGGSPSSPYGAKRAAQGQTAPWTSVFSVIHLELGNEVWNYQSFAGAAVPDAIAYAGRISTIFGAARSSPSYNSASFDLVMGSWAALPWYTGQEMSHGTGYDTVAVAPYLFSSLNDTSSTEAIFGPMFAEPEALDSVPSGYMAQQLAMAGGANGGQPANLAVYEVNLTTNQGSATQALINSTVPSVAGGIAVADHMLLMMRDLGVKTQSIWALPGILNGFSSTTGVPETTPIFGTVIDMGGSTNLRRPAFLAAQLANTAILPNMLAATLSGTNPTWNQPLNTNTNSQLSGAHDLQAFAFTDGGNNRSVIVINLSRTGALPVTFSGANAPVGLVSVGQLTSANISDSNESTGKVKITNSVLINLLPGQSYSLPPYSMTAFTWVAP